MIILETVAPNNSNAVHGRLLIVAAAFLWSLAGVFIKFLDVPPLTIVFYRSLFACLVFTPFVRQIDWQISNALLVSVSTYTAAITAFVSANRLTTAANAIVLQYSRADFCFPVLSPRAARANFKAKWPGSAGWNDRCGDHFLG